MRLVVEARIGGHPTGHCGSVTRTLGWIDTYRLAVEAQYRRLDDILDTLKEQQC